MPGLYPSCSEDKGIPEFPIFEISITKPTLHMPNMGMKTPTFATLPVRYKGKAERISTPTSLADALFATTQQRVLALLFGQPHRSFFTSELIELTGSGSGAV